MMRALDRLRHALARWRMRSSSSLRAQLLWGILLPVFLVLLVNAAVLYHQALAAANTAYDRTLLASAKAIGEQLQVIADGDQARLHAALLYSSLEAFEADNRSRLFYRVSGFDGEMVSGFPDFPPWRGQLPTESTYAALVDFYDDHYQGAPVRVAVLLQPVASATGMGMATVQVAETLELRERLARQLLVDTIWRQLALLGVMAGLVIGVVQRATRPVRALGVALAVRSESDLSPLPTAQAPQELLALLEATNQHMARLSHLLAHQKRFVRDTSHQLRTPLAVLKTQVQSARRGDVPPLQALAEIEHTVDDATVLANQMLALAKAEQLQTQGAHTEVPITDWADVVRHVALDIAPLIADRHLDFELHLPEHAVHVHAHEWALRELARNLLHNALRHSPIGAALRVHLSCKHTGEQPSAVLTVSDHGTGIPEHLRPHLFQPFAKGNPDDGQGSGLGLAICHGIVLALGGGLTLENRAPLGGVQGLDAIAELPLVCSNAS
ncbi:MAG: Sensor protein QseC [Pseudomonadota bacterium]|jgi:two-component system sensor histidine kinase TctE